MTIKRRYKYLIVACIITVAGYFYLTSTTSERYAEITTPDGQYTVYSCRYRYHAFISDFIPFRERDFDTGKAYLLDEYTKKIIASGHIDMVSMGGLTWNETDIYFKGEGPWWKLPRKLSRWE